MDSKELIRAYENRLSEEINNFSNEGYSTSYKEFLKSYEVPLSSYERWCKALGNIVKLNPSKKEEEKIQKFIQQAHLNITPSEALSFSFMSFFVIFILGFFLVLGYWYLFTSGNFDDFPFGVFLLILFCSIFIFYFTYGMPERLAFLWRLKASTQMVPAVLYTVIYMKNTSNFEKAIAFAAQHLDPPLALDFKKIFWNVEVGKYKNVKESVDAYLEETWRGYSLEFIEAFQLIESSLYEPNEERRISFLERALQVILDGVYDRMLRYTHEVKSPLTNIYMLGIILPTLSLAIIPLASAMLQGFIKAAHLFFLFNVIVPFGVFYLTWNVISKRPGGYGNSSYLEKNPLYYKYIDKSAYVKAFFLVFPLLLIGFIPLIFMHTPLYEWIGLESREILLEKIGLGFFGKNTGVFGFINTSEGFKGPFSFISVIFSLFIPLSIALFFITAFKIRTEELIRERKRYKEVEESFTSSLFQLGNRLGDGMPAEIAFGKVAETSKGSSSEGFFLAVEQNITSLGMSVRDAIFDENRGAIIFYPSSLIAISMKIMVESVRKGLQIAARSLLSIAEYVKNMKKVTDRMKDLLADIVSDMKSNMTFLAPLLSGIIIGLSVMITSILLILKNFTSVVGGEAGNIGSFGEGGLASIIKMFNVEEMIPPFWLQIIIGIYLIQIIFILTSTLVAISEGEDDLERTYQTAKNLQTGITLYFVIALISILILSFVGAVVLKGVLSEG
ncbi:MAG: hypothetical protein QXX68_02095 [Candidatus Pacearchaeota archaeon]